MRIPVSLSVAGAVVALIGPASLASGQNLFEEAGHPLARSRWIIVRHLPMIEIALESDDKILVESVDHAPRGLALRIDGEAIAADCRIDESKDNTYTYEISKSGDDEDRQVSTGTSTSINSTLYRASCRFPEGTSARAVRAKAITVQVAMPAGTTEPHDLTAKQLKRFQRLGK